MELPVLTPPDCQDWRPSAKTPRGGGTCLAGKHKDPSFGTCAACLAGTIQPTGDGQRVEYVQVVLAPVQNEWARIHSEAESVGKKSADEISAWVAGIRPFGECGCAAHWTNYVKSHPPSSPLDRWTWDAHNAVNARIGKPVLSYGDAAKLWGWKCEVMLDPSHTL